jgi:hypothetical protein
MILLLKFQINFDDYNGHDSPVKSKNNKNDRFEATILNSIQQ